MSVPMNWATPAMAGIPLMYGKDTQATQRWMQDAAKLDKAATNEALSSVGQMLAPGEKDPTMMEFYLNDMKRGALTNRAQGINMMKGTLAQQMNSLAQSMTATPAKREVTQEGPGTGYQVGMALSQMGGQAMGTGGAGLFF